MEYVALTIFQRKNHLIGRFERKQDAIFARKQAEEKYYGKHRTPR